MNRNIEDVVDKYSHMLLCIALHHVKNDAQAQDIVQETFIRYLHKAPKFHDMSHEKAWLIRVASCLCKDYLKHWWFQKRSDVPIESMIIEHNEETYELLEVVKQLSFHQRNAIYLYYYEDMSVKEIANIYHVSENTVSSWLFRARKKLKILLQGEWDNEE